MASINIQNKKAAFEYSLLESYTAGMQLTGTEIKSLRKGKANLTDAFCVFEGDELFIRNLHINEYDLGTHYNHEPKRSRKLLLNRKELKKLHNKVKEKGLTIAPLRIFLAESGFAKLEISLAKGKKSYDKRESLKDKDVKREMDRRGEE